MSDLTNAQKQSLRDHARELYGRDGELEIDSDNHVCLTSDGFCKVDVWVWVPDEALGVDPSSLTDEREFESAYIEAASHPIADFDETAIASMGDDPGAYVRGFVVFGADSAKAA